MAYQSEGPARMPDVPIDDNWRHRSISMRCNTCMWFVIKPPEDSPKTIAGVLGRCRRHSPSLGGYPAVWSNDWCGDHKLDENKT